MTTDERQNAPGNAEGHLFRLLAIEHTFRRGFFFFFFALSLCRCIRSFSSCSEWALLSSCGEQASHCGGDFSCYRAQALGYVSSIVGALRLTCPKASGIF